MRAERGIALGDADAEAELMADALPSRLQGGDGLRVPRRPSGPRARPGSGTARIVEEHHHAVAGEALERAFVRD